MKFSSSMTATADCNSNHDIDCFFRCHWCVMTQLATPAGYFEVIIVLAPQRRQNS